MIKRIAKWIFVIILIPIVYVLVSLILMLIPINNEEENSQKNESIYLDSNGVHLNLVLAKNQLNSSLINGLNYYENDTFFAFGWGDKNFYLNTPTWGDLTFNNACRALFFKSDALIHFTRYSTTKEEWVEIKVDQNQLDKINQYINNTFSLDSLDNKLLLNDKGYSYNDDFYEAKGNFSCFKTCNTWVNSGLKESDIKALLWTPFDFGLLNIHQK